MIKKTRALMKTSETFQNYWLGTIHKENSDSSFCLYKQISP